jgi:outer membrane lipoprotein-sorting protein
MNAKKAIPLAQYALTVWVLFLAVSLCVGAQGKDDAELQRIYKRMEETGKTFRSFSAHFSQQNYTAKLKAFDTPETGEFYYVRAKDGSVMMRQESVSPGKKILTVKGNKAVFYQPDINQMQIYNLGSYKNLVEYLAIGIGQSPEKLQKDFDISHQGSESVKGEQCSILLLKPKSAKVTAHFSLIMLWIGKSNGILVQNKLLKPNGDYTLLTFTNEKLNVKIPDSQFEQAKPKGVDIQYN